MAKYSNKELHQKIAITIINSVEDEGVFHSLLISCWCGTGAGISIRMNWCASIHIFLIRSSRAPSVFRPRNNLPFNYEKKKFHFTRQRTAFTFCLHSLHYITRFIVFYAIYYQMIKLPIF